MSDLEKDTHGFNEAEMDKAIRQFVDKVRVSYFENGESAKGMPAVAKRIIEDSIDRF